MRLACYVSCAESDEHETHELRPESIKADRPISPHLTSRALASSAKSWATCRSRSMQLGESQNVQRGGSIGSQQQQLLLLLLC